MFKAIFALAAFPLLARANPQYYGPPPGNNSPTSTSAAVAAAAAPSAPADTPGQMNVDVGFNGGFTFHPSNFTAPVGTLVTFYIPSGAIPHSVVQSAFADPCTPLAATGSSPAGFDSGVTTGEQFTINITDASTPIWFFCKVPLHCGMGMVGSINAPTDGNNTFASFMQAALTIGSGGEPTITDNGPVTGGVGADATGPPSSAGASPTSAPSSGSSSSGASRVVVTSMLGLALVVMPLALLA